MTVGFTRGNRKRAGQNRTRERDDNLVTDLKVACAANNSANRFIAIALRKHAQPNPIACRKAPLTREDARELYSIVGLVESLAAAAVAASNSLAAPARSPVFSIAGPEVARTVTPNSLAMT